MSKERLLSALNKSESAVSGNSFDNGRIKKIREDFDKLMPKIKEIRKNVYKTENKKIFLNQK